MFEHGGVTGTSAVELPARPAEPSRVTALDQARTLLARAKAKVGNELGSTATTSEGRQNQLCAYLSAGLLVGLGANALLGWWWADPVAALAIATVAVHEGREAWRGEACCEVC